MRFYERDDAALFRRGLWRVGLISAALLLAGYSPAAQTRSSNEILARAASLIRSGQYDSALLTVKAALRASPSDPGLLTIEGVAYSLKNDDAAALQCLRAALRRDSSYAPALKAEAEILTRQHSPNAIPVLERILKADPTDSIAREMLALQQARTGNCNSAVTNFDAIGSGLSLHPESLQSLGTCLYEQNKFERAATAFTQLLVLKPASRETRYDLALAQMRARQNKAAADTLAPLLQGQPDVDTLSLASEAFEAAGDTPQSVALLRQAIVLDPTLSDSYVRFAELCMLHESYDAGVQMVSAGIARLPRNPALYLSRGMLYGGKGDYDKAEADFHTAETYDPRHGTGAYGVGIVQVQANHPDQALETTREALKAHPEDAQLNFLLARILIESGEGPGSPGFSEATSAAEKAVRLRPDLLSARDLLAKIYSLSDRTEQAIEQCKAALKLDASDQTAMYRLMLASRKMGDTDTAHVLAKRLAEEHQQARDEDTARLRFRLEASEPGETPKQAEKSPAQP